MVAIGNFFFKYRNWIFILFYAALFIPSWPLFSRERFGEYYYYWPIIIGLLITCLGQLIRGLTIGLAYIVRGGKEGKPYVEGLVTEGIFNHCRNPLYVGNILMLLGVGILANSLVYVAIVIPVFLFIYQAIVLAEENFLRGKFGGGVRHLLQQGEPLVPPFAGNWQNFRKHVVQLAALDFEGAHHSIYLAGGYRFIAVSQLPRAHRQRYTAS